MIFTWYVVLVSLGMTDISALLEQKSQENSCEAGPSTHHGVSAFPYKGYGGELQKESCMLSGSLVEPLKLYL